MKYAGLPGHGPSGTAIQASNLAQYWYARMEGSNLPSNQNGMSLQAEYIMLQGMGLQYQPLNPTVSDIKASLQNGNPVMMCGAETGMYDILLGDRVPYNWTPTGNHCIVASGITSDGNLLVHDCANVDQNGVLRPGPRPYDASKLQLVSATALHLFPQDISQQGDLPVLQLSDPMGQFFTQKDANVWHCNNTNVDLHDAHLNYYRQYQGIFGLPRTNEIRLAQMPDAAIVVYERAIAVYDPAKKYDSPPGADAVYLMHTDNGGVGQQIIAKPLISALQAQVDDLNKQIIGLNAELANSKDNTALDALQAQLASYQGAIQQVKVLLQPLANS